MTRIDGGIFLLFFPATLGILTQVIFSHPLHHQFLAFGLFLLALDQARMAVIDLKQIAQSQDQTQDVRLKRFYWVTISTIAIELLGFYLASVYLGVGILLVLGSQVWFNIIVRIRLEPTAADPIQTRPQLEKILLISGNLLGMGLISIWMIDFSPTLIVLGLWSMALIYAVTKLIQFLLNRKAVTLF